MPNALCFSNSLWGHLLYHAFFLHQALSFSLTFICLIAENGISQFWSVFLLITSNIKIFFLYFSELYCHLVSWVSRKPGIIGTSFSCLYPASPQSSIFLKCVYFSPLPNLSTLSIISSLDHSNDLLTCKCSINISWMNEWMNVMCDYIYNDCQLMKLLFVCGLKAWFIT